MLQVINRARAEGNAEMARLGNSPGNVNEGPPTIGGASWSIFTTAQPVAWNTQLAASSQLHANNLQTADWFFNGSSYGNNPHSPNSSFPAGASTASGRISAAGYPHTYSGCRSTTTGFLPGQENIAMGVAFPSNGWSASETLNAFNGAHEGLFEDFTVASRGHRSTMMYECFKEIGIGSATASDFRTSDSTTWDSYYIVQNFGRSSSVTNPVLTGLAYNDLDSNLFFTPNAGESISGLTVEARQGASIVASVSAYDTGGYSLPLPAGTYDIRFVKTDGSFHQVAAVTIAAVNVELNVKTPTFVSGYAAWIASYPGAAAAPGFQQDPDNDGIANGVEHVFGSSPAAPSTGLYQVSSTGTAVKFRHTQTNSLAANVTISYQWSSDPQTWHASGATNPTGTTATISSSTIVNTSAPSLDVIEVTTTVTAGPNKRIYARMIATTP